MRNRHRAGMIGGRRLLSMLLLLAMAFVCCGCSTITIGEETPSSPVGQIIPSRLAIIHTGGMAGSYDADDDSLGIASIAQLAHSLTADGYDTLLLDSGNSIGAISPSDPSDGELAVGLLNAAEYDAVTLGPTELSLGSQLIARRQAQSDFALLSANLIGTAGQTLPGKTRVSFTLSDQRMVGVFGLTGQAQQGDEASIALGGLASSTGDELVEVARQQVAELRSEGCVLVVCLANLEGCGLTASELADQVSGIDVLLDAQGNTAQHRKLVDASGEELLSLTTPVGLSSVSVVLWEQGTLTAKSYGAEQLPDVDEQVEALLTQASLEQDTWMAQEVATSGKALSNKEVTTKETPLGDLVADAALWEARHVGARIMPDAAIIDAGSLVAGLPRGQVTRSMALSVCPHDHTRLLEVQLSGSQLQKLLEDACGALPAATNTFPHVSGITLAVKADGKDGAPRVTISQVNDKPFSAQTNYSVIVTEAVARLLVATRADEGLGTDSITLLDTSAGKALANYLLRECRGIVPARYHKVQGRIKITTPAKKKS